MTMAASQRISTEWLVSFCYFTGSGQVRNTVLGPGRAAQAGQARTGAGLRAESVRHLGEDAETGRRCQNVGQVSRRR